jgi:hypothetical protein
VGVVHGDEQRCPLGQIGGQPVQPVHEREGLVLLVQRTGPAAGPEELVGQCRGARGEQLALFVLGGAQGRLEELEGGAEREVALELAPARREHLHPGAPGEAARRGHELRFAQAEMALDDQHATGAGTGGVEHRADRVEFDVALQQRRRCDRRMEPLVCHAPA